jgi:hypothetical protein
MSFRTVFKNRHVVLPVVHVLNVSQAVRNAKLAIDAGADGVFLINHSITTSHLIKCWRAAVEATGAWIGLNLLGVHPKVLFGDPDLPRGVPGIWVDNALIAHGDEQPDADRVRDDQIRGRWPQLYFGGVAFKYQAPVTEEQLGPLAKAATAYVDVVTTSGTGTGSAPSPDKLRLMKNAIGDHPLAVASGITPDNVADFLPFTDAFLVATGISSNFVELDESKTRALIERVRTFAG